MNKTILFLVFVFLFQLMFAQYEIGTTTITFIDESRSDREIETKVFYPADNAGADMPVADGEFPLLVFGHGFAMVYEAYSNLWDTIVPHGYIMAFPTTESGTLFPAPDHWKFAMDLLYLKHAFDSLDALSGDRFEGKIADKCAVMGHSMGGGATFNAAKDNSVFTTLIAMAPADSKEPNTSVIGALGVTIPSVVFMGENDGVAPPDEHQIPMYNNLASSCKTLITINGGGHCYFGEPNSNCDLGQGMSSPTPTITREEQHDVLYTLLIPYLNYKLKDDMTAQTKFLDSLSASPRTSYESNCFLVNTESINKDNLKTTCYPNPAAKGDVISLELTNDFNGTVEIFDINGKKLIEKQANNTRKVTINSAKLSPGIYFIKATGITNTNTHKIVIQ